MRSIKTKTNLIIMIFLLIVTVLSFNVSHAGTTWTIETVDTSGDVGRYSSLALDSNGNPHISYYDDTYDDLMYSHWTGSSWATEPVDEFGFVGRFCSLALDSGDNPHISYYDDSMNDLKYARLVGSDWITLTHPDLTFYHQYSSLALDSSGNPHISCCEEFPSGHVLYTRWTGSTWNTDIVDNGDFKYSSLALDSNDNPNIAYYDSVNGYLKYVRWTGSSWSFRVVDDSTDDVVFGCSLALDSNDVPHISYYDGANGDLKYARGLGSSFTSWSIETVHESGDVGRFCSLALDSNGNPHISYYDTYDDGRLRYAWRTDSGWYTETVDFSPSGKFSSLALDSNDLPHISYYDDVNDDLKYTSGQAVAPTGSITINGGDEYTTSPEVTLDLTYTAYGSSVDQVRYGNEYPLDSAVWEAPSTSKDWTLTSEDGTKTVFYQIKDDEGMTSSTYMDLILLDTTPPTGSITINGGDASTDSAEVTLSLTYDDATSGVDKVRYTNNAVWGSEPWEDPAPTKQWTLKTGEGTRTVRYQVRDSVGHKSVTYEDDILVEINDPPTVGLISGPTYGTTDVEYSWTVTGSDPDGDDLTYEWQLDGQTQGATGSSLTHTFGDSDDLGNHKIRVRAVDEEGETSGWTDIIFTLGVDKNDPPMISEISGPDSAFVGDSCTWTASATDPEGSDVTIYWFINGATQGSGDSFTYSFETEPAGKYTIQARAKDVGGASSGYVVLAFVLMEESGFESCFFDVFAKEEVYVVETFSNSSVMDLVFNQTQKKIRFSFIGVDGTAGFCNVTFPAELLSGDFTVFLDAVELVEGVDYSESFNGTHHTLSVNYEHSSHKIDVVGTNVIPDFAASLFLPLVMTGTLLALTLRKKLKKLI